MKHVLLFALIIGFSACGGAGSKEAKTEETPAEAVEMMAETPMDSMQMRTMPTDSLAEENDED